MLEETKRKISKANSGRKCPPRSVEYRKNLSKRMVGKNNPWYGKHLPESIKEKMREPHLGEKNHQWLGGVSFEPYGLKFNKKLKEEIRKRDGYRCQECFRQQDELFKNTKAGVRQYKLFIHHIDYNKRNNNKDNLISLCLLCHNQTNFTRRNWTNYYQERMITK